jgi:hypothetical protein
MMNKSAQNVADVMMRRKKMQMSDQHIDAVLAEAQKLLWGGSESENIAAHNLINNLIQDRMTFQNLN